MLIIVYAFNKVVHDYLTGERQNQLVVHLHDHFAAARFSIEQQKRHFNGLRVEPEDERMAGLGDALAIRDTLSARCQVVGVIAGTHVIAWAYNGSRRICSQVDQCGRNHGFEAR
jgi:YD repeat-containing protein